MIFFDESRSTWRSDAAGADPGADQGGPVGVTGGRVSVFDFGGRVLRVLDDPAGGNATLNPDGTVALVLPDGGAGGRSSFRVEIETGSGPRAVEVPLSIGAPAQKGGWGAGEHYALATDAAGGSVVEPGENHRKVYVTAGENGLSRAEIAAREGIAASKVTAEWLEAHPEYGSSPGTALDQEAGAALWYQIADREALPASHWLLLERGHDYDDIGRVIGRGATGESALHPLLVIAWGTGSDPVIESPVTGFQARTENVAIVDVDLTAGLIILQAENILLEGLDVEGKGLNLQGIDGLTLRRSTIADVAYKESPSKSEWNSESKISGAFVKASDRVLIEDVLADHSGWSDGYDFNLSTSKSQAPSKLSHNLYLQKDVSDLTFRDNVVMRGAESAAQIRGGGVIEGNVFIGNDTAFNVGQGNYSLVRDNPVTLAGYHEVARYGGALAWGIDNLSQDAASEGPAAARCHDNRARRFRAGPARRRRMPACWPSPSRSPGSGTASCGLRAPRDSPVRTEQAGDSREEGQDMIIGTTGKALNGRGFSQGIGVTA